MRQYSPATARQNALDRNPTKVSGTGSASVTGGLTSDIASYTVPAGRAAELRVATIAGVVTTALAAGQTADLQILYQDNIPTSHEVVFIRLPVAAALGTKDHAEVPGLYLRAAGAITLRGKESAGAGVTFVSGGFEGIEYDA